MTLELLTVRSHAMTPEQSDSVIALCSEVFEVDYAYYMALCADRVHILGYANGQLVAHALWLDRPLRMADGPWLSSAYVEGVATHADHRGRGYGAAVMHRLQAEISAYDLGALSTAVPGWYARLGWQRWRGRLWIDRDGSREASPADEIVMVHRTPRTPRLDLDVSLTAPWRPFEPW